MGRFNIMMLSYQYKDSIIKMRGSWYHLLFIMRIYCPYIMKLKKPGKDICVFAVSLCATFFFTGQPRVFQFSEQYFQNAVSLRSLCIISLWPSDAIWHQRSGSTLAQVMACCLTAPSHYLNQCWLIISEVQRHSPGRNFIRDISTINL